MYFCGITCNLSPFLFNCVYLDAPFFSWWAYLKACRFCLTFQRNSSWIYWSLELFFLSLCHLILLWSWLFPSFYLLWAVFVVVLWVLVGMGLGCLFEMFLSLLRRPVSLWTISQDCLCGLPEVLDCSEFIFICFQKHFDFFLDLNLDPFIVE